MVCRNAGELSTRAWGGGAWKEDRGLGDTMCVGMLRISQTSAGRKIRPGETGGPRDILSPARRCQRITRGRGKDEKFGKEVIAKKPGRDSLWRYKVEP
jgi:hypothetical protein